MIIIRLKGGLGNQMFQFAIGHIMSIKNNCTLKIDTQFFDLSKTDANVTARDFELDIFSIDYVLANQNDLLTYNKLSVVNRIKKKLGFNYPKKYNQSSSEYQKDLFLFKPPVFINGYFQSYKYYQGYEKNLKELFSFSVNVFQEKNLEILNLIETATTVSVHIRRGDYVKSLKVSQKHGVCSIEYYLNAIKLLSNKYDNLKFIFFSDECDWAINTFSHIAIDKIFVNHNIGNESWKDMCLMSKCNHNIIANSSFSWWAAWLNTYPEKTVITPKRWFTNSNKNTNDLIPLEWIQL